MIEVRAENTEFRYLPREADLPSTISISDAPGQLPPFMAERRGSAEDWRVTVMEAVHPRVPPSVYFLHWSGDVDLDAVDARVVNGSYTDDDFRESIRALYERTRCFQCGRTWNTLIVPPEKYLGASDLLDQKIQRRAARNQFLTCPACHVSLRQLVVKIFDEPVDVPRAEGS